MMAAARKLLHAVGAVPGIGRNGREEVGRDESKRRMPRSVRVKSGVRFRVPSAVVADQHLVRDGKGANALQI